jgi:hypothetical protein
MKPKKKEIRQQTVSQIVRTTNKDGMEIIGFTVYCGDDSFYNVMRSFSAENYDQVYSALEKQRRQILNNPKTKEKK